MTHKFVQFAALVCLAGSALAAQAVCPPPPPIKFDPHATSVDRIKFDPHAISIQSK